MIICKLFLKQMTPTKKSKLKFDNNQIFYLKKDYCFELFNVSSNITKINI